MRNNFSKLITGFVTSSLSGKKKGEFVKRKIFVGEDNFTFQTYLPPQAKSAENLPLMIFLHGIRERGYGGYIAGKYSMIIKQYLKEIPAVILFPQCKPGVYWPDPQMDKMVMRSVDSVTDEFSIDERRKYLIGVSMGGYGVWHFGSNYPKDFAALVSICGGSPLTEGDRFTSIARKIGQTPARIYHGSDDEIVQVSESRNMTRAIRENGGRVEYSEYKDVGHNVWLNVLGEKDLMPWILSQEITN